MVTATATPIPPAIQAALPKRRDGATLSLRRVLLLISSLSLTTRDRYFAVSVIFLLSISWPRRITVTVTSQFASHRDLALASVPSLPRA